MTRLIAAISAAGLIAAFLAIQSATVPTASAQPAVCLNLPAGEHRFEATARERAGTVTFRVEVGEGGVLIQFYEPGGVGVGVGAFVDTFTGADAYDLPDGVEIVECGASTQGGASSGASEVAFCSSLPAGSVTETISAGGRSYELTINVGEGGRIIDVSVLGQTYGVQEAVALLQNFGVTLPEGLGIAPCAAAPSVPSGKGDTGNAGLADRSGAPTLGYVAVAIAALAVAAASLAARRRIRARE